jgi:kanamycin nucleotidyltransferase
MTHEERLQIARELAQKILDKHGDNVTAIAIYGSTAKGEDGPHSDLDLWVATRQPMDDTRFFVYRGMPISINWDTEEGRIRSAGRVTSFWPMDADEFRSYIVLFERGDFIRKLQEAAKALKEEDFTNSVQVRMARTQESANKVRQAWGRGDRYTLLAEARALAWSVAMTLGVLNRRYYRSGRGFYQASKEMPLQPRDYARLLDLAGGFTTVEPAQVYNAGMQLWDNLVQLVGEVGIRWDFDEIPL